MYVLVLRQILRDPLQASGSPLYVDPSSLPTTHILGLAADPEYAVFHPASETSVVSLDPLPSESCHLESVSRQKPRWLWLSCDFSLSKEHSLYTMPYLTLGFYIFSCFTAVFIVIKSLLSLWLKLQFCLSGFQTSDWNHLSHLLVCPLRPTERLAFYRNLS